MVNRLRSFISSMTYKCYKMKRKTFAADKIRNSVEKYGFWIGIVIGFVLGLLYVWLMAYLNNSGNNGYQHMHSDCVTNSTVKKPFQHTHHKSNVTRNLEQNIKILCWVMTNPKNHRTKAMAVNQTWGHRCNKLLFMSSQSDSVLNTIQLPVVEGRHSLWAKTKEAFKYVYNNHIDDYDWFLKADDDTYVIVENLRYMLSAYSPSTPIYFGNKFRAYIKQGYMGGGAGYVLSKTALMRFVENGLTNKTICRAENNGFEDVEMGLCMQNVHIVAGNSRDLNGNERFFSYQPELELSPTLLTTQPWLEQFLYYQRNVGANTCSDTAISFHYVHPMEMFILDYLLYHIHPYGVIGKTGVQLPKKLSISELLKALNLNKSTVPITWNVSAEAGDYDYGYRFRFQSDDFENK